MVPVLLLALVLAACTAGQPVRESDPSRTSGSAASPTTAAPTPTTTTTTTRTAATKPTTSARAVVEQPSKAHPTEQTPVQPRYSCEPGAPPKFDDPANPNIITNRDCPELDAEKERSHREFINCEPSGGTWNIDRQRCVYGQDRQEPPG